MYYIEIEVKFKKNKRLKFKGPKKLLKKLQIDKENEMETFFILSSMANIDESSNGEFFLDINKNRYSKKDIIKKVLKNRKEQ